MLRRTSRRQVILAALPLFSCTLLAACGQPAPRVAAGATPTAAPAAATGSSRSSTVQPAVSTIVQPSSGTTAIDFTHWLIGGPPGIAAFNKLVTLFEHDHPNIHVKNETPPGNYWQAIQTRLAGGDAPDVMAIDNYDVTALAVKGGAMPLDDLIASSKFNLGIYYPIALGEGVYQGKRYGLPYIGSTRVLGYNKDLFTKAGLPTPAERWKKGEWTWEIFLESAQKLTKRDASGRPLQFGFQVSPLLEVMPHWIFANCGEVLNKTRTTCLLDQPKAMGAITFLRDLIYKYRVAPTSAETSTINLQAAGRLGMWGDWRGNATYERTYKFQWDIALPPIVPSVGKSAMYKGNSMVLYRQTKQVDAAWQFAQFICGPVANRAFVSLGGASPVSVPEVRDVFLQSTPPQNNQYYLEPLLQNYAHLLPLNPHWPEMATKADSALQDIFQSNKDIRTVLGTLTPEINQILAGSVG